MTVFDDDRELLDGFRQGTPEALDRVFRFYVDEVAWLVRRGFFLDNGRQVPGVRNAEDQRELVQEVFARAFSGKARHAYDGLRPYRPYLMQVARNLLVDHWRRQGTRSPESVSIQDDDPRDRLERLPAPACDPVDELQWQRWTEATRRYLSGLDEELRQIVSLRFEQERSQAEVSEKLGISRWRVRALEGKVQAGLRRYLKRHKLL